MPDALDPKYNFVWDANPPSVKFQNLLIGFVDITNLVIRDAALHIFKKCKFQF